MDITQRVDRFCLRQLSLIITGPPNGPVLFCSLSSVVVCNADGGGESRPPGAWSVGRPTLHGRPVGLRPVRATLVVFLFAELSIFIAFIRYRLHFSFISFTVHLGTPTF